MALWRKSWSTKYWVLEAGLYYEMQLTKLSHDVRNESVLEEWTWTGRTALGDVRGAYDEGKGGGKGNGKAGGKGSGKTACLTGKGDGKTDSPTSDVEHSGPTWPAGNLGDPGHSSGTGKGATTFEARSEKRRMV